MPEWLAKSSAIFTRDARLAFAYPMSFAGQWFGIAGQVLTFYFISRLVGPLPAYGVAGHPATYFEYVAVNLAFVRFQSTAIYSFQHAMRGAQMIGTIEVLMATPTPLALLIVASGLWAFAVTIAQIVFYLAIAHGLGLQLGHTNAATAVLFLLLTLSSMAPLGILSAAGIMLFKQEAPTSLLFGGAASLLGGVLFPVARLPHWIQPLSWLLPITHSLNGIRGAVAGATIADLWPDVIWLGIMTIVVGPLSLYAFSRAVRRAKVDGTLGDY